MTSTRLLLLSGFIAILSGFPALQAQNSYGPQFLWGAAISAHQVEGISGGGQYSDWYLFEHTNHNILNGDTADVATDHWHLYAQDFAIAATVGLMPFGLQWPGRRSSPPWVLSVPMLLHTTAPSSRPCEGCDSGQ